LNRIAKRARSARGRPPTVTELIRGVKAPTFAAATDKAGTRPRRTWMHPPSVQITFAPGM